MKQLTPLWATLSLLGWSHQALAACGDGRWDSATEECDDANTSDGDGCAADCTIEEGYTCRNAPDLNTGSTLAGGQASPGGTDRVWQWSETLHGALNPAAVAGNCAPASWVSAPAYANWINRYGCGVTTPEATTTFYIATFELASAASAAHTVLNGTFWADNSVYDVYVNGTATGVAFGPIGYTGLGVDFGDWPSALYKPGVNQIAIEVYNDYGLTGNPDGLLVTLPNANGLGSVCEVSCGDGIAESWEECDDGNNVNGDGCSTSCLDETIDRDGDGASVGDGDCDDNDNTVYPGASDPAGDGVDQDCDGLDGDPCDVDADGFDAISCGGTDCDDTDAGVNPAATELPL
ncbi:MAG: DUF4215 domain-containing protein, partial [Deltaproteobacteria bacterium]|nr:DUF4215 domain-containing protein [Deltaproteobacteria bacterium]